MDADCKSSFTPDPCRRVLSLKDATATPTAALEPTIPLSSVQEVGSVFDKVFTPKHLRDENEERLSSSPPLAEQVINVSPSRVTVDLSNPVFHQLAESDTPLDDKLRRVFSRPGKEFIPKSEEGCTPFVDNGADRDRSPERADEDFDENNDLQELRNPERHYDEANNFCPAPETIDTESYRDAQPHKPPLGGRFGQFNVMTPITERTFEFTVSTRGEGTPQSPFEAFVNAGRLAKEVRQEEDGRLSDFEDDEHASSSEGNQRPDESFTGLDRRGIPLEQGMHAITIEDSEDEETEAAITAIDEKTGTLSLIDALTVSSSFKPPNPCVPFDPPIMATLLSVIPTDSGYHDLRDRDARLLDGLQKFAQKKRKMSGNSTSNLTLDMSQRHKLVVADRAFEVVDKLGEGSFGCVFAAKCVVGKGIQGDDDDDGTDEDEDEDESMVALKVVKPRNLWEYHVLRRLRCTLPSNLQRSVVTPHALYAFRDESFLILGLGTQGTLLDIVNRASQAGVTQQGACLDELLVMFFTIELVRLLEGMHGTGFIHGDLKIDNCLLRLEDVPGGTSAWSSVYQPSGQGGWSYKGIKVIDFGRTIDTRLFPPGQTFVADWKIDARDCQEMRENRSWTFQTDYFGLAGIIYCMLFGKYIEGSSVVMSPSSGTGQHYKIATPFKRYWQIELWTKLFTILLNPCTVRGDHHLPLCEELCVVRREMEEWLQRNCNRTGNTLKGLLKKVEVAALRRFG
jgi:checkpoint serine/threonine-protein kinase